ncbi:type VII toxin-antitoxin system MntA family adenylyltransferase antitoxin [Candidatus Caldatribacterium saccharofermentans]|uniref:type VII toxin-antitoxin system MntA family adenylyltransferase antitoxin n=1 Tax=Candidatus Caldatribacterium saccharofermentans TaxID=1454753 RepID=UPI003CFCE9F9
MGIASDYRGPSGKILPAAIVNADEIVRRLHPVFAGQNEVLLAYLFGSYARGDNGTWSDVDLAVFLRPGVKGDELFEAYRELYLVIRNALSTERFDLLLLNRASLPLKFEVVSGGRLIYAQNEEVLNSFEIDVIRRYQDTAYLRKVQTRYFQERVRRWYSKGRA